MGVLLAGCSGGGRDAVQMSTLMQPAGTFSTDQATLLALNMEWLPLLFPGIFTAGGGTGHPTDPVEVDHPDGSMTITFTDSDGTQETWDLSADQSHQTSRLVHPGGCVETQVYVIVLNADGSVDVTETATYCDGSHLERTFHCPPWSDGADHLYNSQVGKFTLANGEVLDFTMSQYGLHFVLHVDGHEGWVYDLSTPSILGHEWPDSSRPATGTFTRGTQVTSFILPANPGGTQWQNMTLTAPAGITGAYALSAVLTGTGTVKQSGQILMTVLWGSDGRIAATYADGHSEVGEPSAAARDFLIDKWLWDLASFGPNPR